MSSMVSKTNISNLLSFLKLFLFHGFAMLDLAVNLIFGVKIEFLKVSITKFGF